MQLLSGALFFAVTCAACAQTFTRVNAFQSGAVADPASLVAADFDRDGKADVAMVNRGADYITVLLSRGDDTFQTVPPARACAPMVAVAAIDFHGDGVPDLAALCASRLVVLRGLGDGSFSQASVYDFDGPANSLLAGDFDGDRRPDLAVLLVHKMRVLLGAGNGTFVSQPDIPIQALYARAAAANFNGDGRADFAAVEYLSPIFLVNFARGDGSFQAVQCFSCGPPAAVPTEAVLADVDGDGNGELVILSPPNSLTVARRGADGAFQGTTSQAPAIGLAAAAAADFDGDGVPDLAVVDGASNALLVFLGGGDGSFAAPALAGSLPARIGEEDLPVSAWQIVTGDFDGNGYTDLAILSAPDFSILDYQDPPRSVTILLGNGDGTFREGGRWDQPYPTGRMAAGDFDGDGKSDLAIANASIYMEGSLYPNLSVLLSNGDGTFRSAGDYVSGRNPSAVAAGDFDGDGKLDVAVANADAASVLLGNGDGTLKPMAEFRAPSFRAEIVTADFNGDGRPDLAVAGPRGASILLGTGGGAFEAPVDLPVTAACAVTSCISPPLAAADLDGGGSAGLVVADSLLSPSNGGFQQPLWLGDGVPPSAVVVQDFNGDGKPDLALVRATGVFVLLRQ